MPETCDTPVYVVQVEGRYDDGAAVIGAFVDMDEAFAFADRHEADTVLVCCGGDVRIIDLEWCPQTMVWSLRRKLKPPFVGYQYGPLMTAKLAQYRKAA